MKHAKTTDCFINPPLVARDLDTRSSLCPRVNVQDMLLHVNTDAFPFTSWRRSQLLRREFQRHGQYFEGHLSPHPPSEPLDPEQRHSAQALMSSFPSDPSDVDFPDHFGLHWDVWVVDQRSHPSNVDFLLWKSVVDRDPEALCEAVFVLFDRLKVARQERRRGCNSAKCWQTALSRPSSRGQKLPSPWFTLLRGPVSADAFLCRRQSGSRYQTN